MPTSTSTAAIEVGTISADRLLDAWERASQVAEPGRGAELANSLGLLSDAWRTPLAECDRVLVEVQRAIFGDRVELTMECATCEAILEVDLELEPLTAASAVGEQLDVETSVGPLVVRAVTTTDLVAISESLDPVAMLLERLVSRPDGSVVTALSQGDQDLVDLAAQELAGVAGSTLAASCPSCGEQNRAAIDPAAWGWDRLELWAERQLEEVATLARAYGWTETEVLALSPSRRARYLELAERS